MLPVSESRGSDRRRRFSESRRSSRQGAAKTRAVSANGCFRWIRLLRTPSASGRFSATLRATGDPRPTFRPSDAANQEAIVKQRLELFALSGLLLCSTVACNGDVSLGKNGI